MGSWLVSPDHAERLSRHALDEITAPDSGVRAFYLKDPRQGRMMSTLVVFTPEGIAIMGDLTPSHNGDVSALGYGLGWFAGSLAPDYLCSKFLRREWYREAAERHLEARVAEIEADVTALEAERAKRVEAVLREGVEAAADGCEVPPDDELIASDDEILSLDADIAKMRTRIANFREVLGRIDDLGPESMHRALDEIDEDPDGIGCDYPPGAAWLVAIQRRFAELWKTRQTENGGDHA